MEYCDKIDICVKLLEGYLQRLDDEVRQRNMKNLLQEREGWVETQMTNWLAAEIKQTYKFDVWDADFYFSIDVMAILIAKLNSLKVEESSTN